MCGTNGAEISKYGVEINTILSFPLFLLLGLQISKYLFFFVRWSCWSKAEAWKWIWIWVWHPSWLTIGPSTSWICIQWQTCQEISLWGWPSELRSFLHSSTFSVGCYSQFSFFVTNLMDFFCRGLELQVICFWLYHHFLHY